MKQEFQALGHIVEVPELRMSSNGQPFTYLRVACKSHKKQETIFLSVLLNRKNATNACKYLQKGDVIFATGELKVNKNIKDGKTYVGLSLLADDIRFIPYRRKEVSKESIQ
jgi:single-stranded DNA-binding protein